MTGGAGAGRGRHHEVVRWYLGWVAAVFTFFFSFYSLVWRLPLYPAFYPTRPQWVIRHQLQSYTLVCQGLNDLISRVLPHLCESYKSGGVVCHNSNHRKLGLTPPIKWAEHGLRPARPTSPPAQLISPTHQPSTSAPPTSPAHQPRHQPSPILSPHSTPPAQPTYFHIFGDRQGRARYKRWPRPP